MKYEKYTELFVTSDYLEYEFKSLGPKGTIHKIIQFTEAKFAAVYNMAFGNKLVDGSIDDLAIDNNKDRNKILATVVTILKIFFDHYPNQQVYFTGSTPARTRLYRMAITLNLEELNSDFEIVGTLSDSDIPNNAPFTKGVNYFGFLIRSKNFNFRKQYKILLYDTTRDRERTND
jgi:hypothetical protein